MADVNKPKSPQSQPGSSGGSQKFTFRCADMGKPDCTWQTQGSSQDEVLRNVEQHAREKHNLTNLDENTRNQVRNQIRQAA